jgi:hypothetical protein
MVDQSVTESYNLVVEPGLPVSSPSEAARLFSCLRPGPVRRLSYVQHRYIVMCRTEDYDNTSTRIMTLLGFRLYRAGAVRLP